MTEFIIIRKKDFDYQYEKLFNKLYTCIRERSKDINDIPLPVNRALYFCDMVNEIINSHHNNFMNNIKEYKIINFVDKEKEKQEAFEDLCVACSA